MNNTIPIILAAACMLGTPSCVQWDIGGKVREGAVSYKGVDLGPTGNRLRPGEPVPEVSYRLEQPCIRSVGFIAGDMRRPRVVDLQPTGQSRPAPAPAAAPEMHEAGGHMILQTERTETPSAGRSAAAFPCDYLLDPLLQIISAPVFFLFY